MRPQVAFKLFTSFGVRTDVGVSASFNLRKKKHFESDTIRRSKLSELLEQNHFESAQTCRAILSELREGQVSSNDKTQWGLTNERNRI